MSHTQIVRYSNVDWVDTPSDRCFTSSSCVFVEENLIARKSKKQNVVVKSSV